MKNIIFSFIIFISLFLPSGVYGQKNIAALNAENPYITQEAILKSFYAGKVKRALSGLRTYSDRYNAVSFAAYPRTFIEDRIPNLAPYDKKGELFKDVLATSYKELKRQKAVNVRALADKTVAEIVLNPRRVDVSKRIPFPDKGDVWYGAFYLSSYYQQLNDFIRAINEEEKVYKDYAKYLANGDSFMLSGYEGYDFDLVKGKYEKGVFLKRKREIENFIRAYSDKADGFIRRVLVPMQSDAITGADVRAYIDRHLSGAALPAGVSAKALKEVLAEGIPEAEYFYKEAEKLDPSFFTQVSSLGRIFFNSMNAKGEDISNALSLMEYISPGTLAERLNRYGKIPSREKVIEDIATSMAAGALNRSLAQIANDLFEFEKPFYYADYTFGNAEMAIVSNWRDIALNQHFGGKKIGQIAMDNIIQSGKRAGQDRLLSQQLNKRRIDKNIEFYEDAFPIAIDFASGDLVYAMASPILKGGRYLMAARVKDLTASIKGLKYAPQAATKNLGKLFGVKTAKNIKSADGLIRPVWQLSDESGEVVYYFKYGSKRELYRTKQIDKIIKEQNLASKYNLIEIEYPHVVSEGLEGLPPEMAEKISSDMKNIASKMRDSKNRLEAQFVTNKVDASGFTLANASPESIALLNNIPITKEEWKQIVAFYGDLNKSGFYHTDIWNNLHIRRLENGKLKITLLDFEHLGVSDMLELEDLEKKLRAMHLREKKGSANYLKEFGPEAARSDMGRWPL